MSISILFAGMFLFFVSSPGYSVRPAGTVSYAISADSLKTPVFTSEKLNAAILDYVRTLNQFLEDSEQNKPDALSVMMRQLSPINEKIMRQADQLSDEELDVLQQYLEQYGRYIQAQVDRHFQAQIEVMESELQKGKAEAEQLEKEATTNEEP